MLLAFLVVHVIKAGTLDIISLRHQRQTFPSEKAWLRQEDSPILLKRMLRLFLRQIRPILEGKMPLVLLLTVLNPNWRSLTWETPMKVEQSPSQTVQELNAELRVEKLQNIEWFV